MVVLVLCAIAAAWWNIQLLARSVGKIVLMIASLTLSLAGFKWLSMAINYCKTMMRF